MTKELVFPDPDLQSQRRWGDPGPGDDEVLERQTAPQARDEALEQLQKAIKRYDERPDVNAINRVVGAARALAVRKK